MNTNNNPVNLKKSAQAVQNTLNQLGLDLVVKEFPESTRTAPQAADAIGCQVGQIAKSLIFKGIITGEPILIIASGKNRVNEKSIAIHCGQQLEKATADFVLEHTGFAIGGIPPVGHSKTITTFIDQDLMAYKEIWAAAGTANAVFKLGPRDLLQITRGKVISVI